MRTRGSKITKILRTSYLEAPERDRVDASANECDNRPRTPTLLLPPLRDGDTRAHGWPRSLRCTIMGNFHNFNDLEQKIIAQAGQFSEDVFLGGFATFRRRRNRSFQILLDSFNHGY